MRRSNFVPAATDPHECVGLGLIALFRVELIAEEGD